MGIPKKRGKQTDDAKGAILSQKYKLYLRKEIDEYNSNDLVFYFADVYKKVKGVPYFISMVEDSVKIKRLQSGLDNYTIVKLMNHVVENKKDINIGMLCSTWVNSFIKDAGINHPEFTRYEVAIDSPFITKNEREVTRSYFDKMVFASDNGDIHGEVYWGNKLDNVCKEIKRRKVLLTE